MKETIRKLDLRSISTSYKLGITRNTKKLGPLTESKLNEQSKIAYKNRAEIFELKENKGLFIYILNYYSKIPIEILETAIIEEDKKSSAINIFIQKEDWGNLSYPAESISRHGIYINIYYVPKNKSKIEQSHESEHTKTYLMRYPITQNSIRTIKELLLNEIISYIKTLIIDLKFSKNESIEKIQKIFGFSYNSGYIQEYLKNYLKDKKLSPEKIRSIEDNILDELGQKLHAISNTLDILTPQEVMFVLRYSTWDNMERKLLERSVIKQRYYKARQR